MNQRKSRIILTALLMALGLVVGLFATGGSSAMAATSTPRASNAGLVLRPDGTPVTICLLNASTLCADVQNNSNTVGTGIYLQKGGADDKWVLQPDNTCTEGNCYYFEDAQNTSLCMAATGTNGAHVALERCAESGSWYNEGGNNVGNAFYGSGGGIYTNANGAGYYLYSGQNGPWHRWSIPGFN